MELKSIIQGRLEFAKLSSYEKVEKMYHYRLENFYKSELMFEPEEILDPDNFAFTIPRLIHNPEKRIWNNTIRILEYVSQFAVAGYVSAWLIENRKVIENYHIEPDNEKSVVRNFILGRKLSEEDGKEKEALAALDRAIGKFAKHALAYERRGAVNFKLGKYKEAFKDFKTCIDLDPNYTAAFFSRGKMHLHSEKWAEAIGDFDNAVRNSVALQDIHWHGRRMLAHCYAQINEHEKAAFNLKLLANRNFRPDSSNYKLRQKANYDYAELLINMEKYDEALKAIENAMNIEEEQDQVPVESMLLVRGRAKQLVGAQGFAADWKKAADLGSKEALALLSQHSSKS